MLFVSLEIRHLMSGGPLDATEYGFTERSIQTIAWLAAAYALYAGRPTAGRSVAVWGWRILAGLAVGQLVFLQILVDNLGLAPSRSGAGRSSTCCCRAIWCLPGSPSCSCSPRTDAATPG